MITRHPRRGRTGSQTHVRGRDRAARGSRRRSGAVAPEPWRTAGTRVVHDVPQADLAWY